MQISKVGLYTNNNSQSKPAFKINPEDTASTLGYLNSLAGIKEGSAEIERQICAKVESEIVAHAKTLKPDAGAFWWLSFDKGGIKVNLTKRQADYVPGKPELTGSSKQLIQKPASLDKIKAAFIEAIDNLSAPKGE